MKNNIVFSKSTNTIRQMPQNYLLAVKNNGAWCLDFDLACSPVIARKVATVYLNYSVKYGTGENFIKCLKGGNTMRIIKTIIALILICQMAFITYQVYTFNTPIELDAIVYPDIAIDLTIPKHKQSRKYMTCKHCENKLNKPIDKLQ